MMKRIISNIPWRYGYIRKNFVDSIEISSSRCIDNQADNALTFAELTTWALQIYVASA